MINAQVKKAPFPPQHTHTPNKIRHSPPFRRDNGSAAPATHHSLPNTVGCVNMADSHIHRGRTVARVWVSSPGLNVSAPPLTPHDNETLATPDPSHQSVTRWLQNCSFALSSHIPSAWHTHSNSYTRCTQTFQPGNKTFPGICAGKTCTVCTCCLLVSHTFGPERL